MNDKAGQGNIRSIARLSYPADRESGRAGEEGGGGDLEHSAPPNAFSPERRPALDDDRLGNNQLPECVSECRPEPSPGNYFQNDLRKSGNLHSDQPKLEGAEIRNSWLFTLDP